MEKIKSGIRKNKIVMLIFWIALIYILSIFIIKGVLKSNFTSLQIAFIFAIGCFTYIDVSLSVEYFQLKKMISEIRNIQAKYNYMQIYMEKNNMIVEIQNEEIERLQKDIQHLGYRMIEINKEEKVVQYAIKL